MRWDFRPPSWTYHGITVEHDDGTKIKFGRSGIYWISLAICQNCKLDGFVTITQHGASRTRQRVVRRIRGGKGPPFLLEICAGDKLSVHVPLRTWHSVQNQDSLDITRYSDIKLKVSLWTCE